MMAQTLTKPFTVEEFENHFNNQLLGRFYTSNGNSSEKLINIYGVALQEAIKAKKQKLSDYIIGILACGQSVKPYNTRDVHSLDFLVITKEGNLPLDREIDKGFGVLNANKLHFYFRTAGQMNDDILKPYFIAEKMAEARDHGVPIVLDEDKFSLKEWAKVRGEDARTFEWYQDNNSLWNVKVK